MPPTMVAMTSLGSGARSWLVTLAVLGVVALVVGLAGGFRGAEGPPADTATGEWVESTRWDVRVDDCRIIPAQERFGEMDPPQVAILMTVRNTWDETQMGFSQAMVRIEVPNGESFGAQREQFSMGDAERDGYFDPGITRPAVLTGDIAGGLWDPAEPVRVRLATERQDRGFVTDDRWATDREVATLDLDCPMASAP